MSLSPIWEERKLVAKQYPMKSLLEHIGFEVNKYGMTLCPFHSDSDSSAKVGTKENILHCFGCGVNKDTVSVYMEVTGADFRTSVNDINDMAGNSYQPSEKIKEQVDKAKRLRIELEKEAAEQKKKEDTMSPEEKYQRFLGWFKPYTSLSKSDKAIVDTYLQSKYLNDIRGILLANKLDIGLDMRGNVCYRLNGFGIIITQDRKINQGSPAPTLISVDKGNPLWFICEGMSDALTASKLGYNAISIHSVNNIDKLKEKLSNSQTASKFTYVIATDNDNAGRRAKADLISFFSANDIEYTVNSLLDGAPEGADLNSIYISEQRKNTCVQVGT